MSSPAGATVAGNLVKLGEGYPLGFRFGVDRLIDGIDSYIGTRS